jgi:hypothetical protein
MRESGVVQCWPDTDMSSNPGLIPNFLVADDPEKT